MAESGILLINKEVGISSNKVVNIVKRHLGAKKCGHLGTLDLEGAGLLPVTVEKATKLFDYFLGKDKTYETVFVFGVETDTLDMSGQVLKSQECHITKEMVEEAIKQMVGKQLQMPPQYSAKKVNGQIAYKEARKGNTVELRPKEIEIYHFKLLEEFQENIFKFSISCSSGTYIRSVARDLGEKLGTYGSMQCILRTRCGGFYLKDAFTLQDVENGNFKLIKMEDVFDFPKLSLSKGDSEKLLNGQKIKIEEGDGKYKLFASTVFLGLGKVENGILTFKLRLI